MTARTSTLHSFGAWRIGLRRVRDFGQSSTVSRWAVFNRSTGEVRGFHRDRAGALSALRGISKEKKS